MDIQQSDRENTPLGDPGQGVGRGNFTPGPWRAETWDCAPEVNEDGNRFWAIVPETFQYGNLYLSASGWMTEANAHLIAAAPDLLEALENIVRKFDDAPDFVKGVPLKIMKARTAIAKARGE